MNSIISCLCVAVLVFAAFSVIRGLLGRGRGGNNWGNNGYTNQGYNNQGWGGDAGSFLSGMGIGWLFGNWVNNDHHHHINNHDTIIDSNNDGIPDNTNPDGGWFDWGNNDTDSGSWGGDGGGWGGDGGGGWGGDSA